MYTIEKNTENEIIIKNSKFICILYKINSQEEINKLLENIKYIYKDATHYCYAYILDNYKKSSDDGEPGGTAGIPMLQVLEKNNLNYILCITIRYFGGIKLGAGGLVRAYTKSITEALKTTNLIKLTTGYEIILNFPYEIQNQIDYLLKEEKIITKNYEETITYKVNIHENTLKNLNQLSNIKITIINNIYI